MNSQPPTSSPLFDLSLIGPLGIGLILIFLAAGFGFFYLSFTTRHGRSRWPLHALMALGITSIGSGVSWAACGVISQIRAYSMLTAEAGGDPATMATGFASALIGPCWLGLVGALLGSLALVRAIAGLIREPGPRF